MKTVNDILQTAERLLFPHRCLFCRRFIPAGYLCEECRGDIDYPLKEISFDADGRIIPAFVLSAGRYSGEYRKSVEIFKFRGAYRLADAFAGLMCEAFDSIYGEASDSCDLITFVPMSGKSQRKRGYNQSEKLASSVSKLMNIPCRRLIEKTGTNLTQHSLDAEGRKLNVKGVYSAVSSAETEGKRIILVDDIVTTGATLSECMKVLYEAGAEKVYPVCAAEAVGNGSI